MVMRIEGDRPPGGTLEGAYNFLPPPLPSFHPGSIAIVVRPGQNMKDRNFSEKPRKASRNWSMPIVDRAFVGFLFHSMRAHSSSNSSINLFEARIQPARSEGEGTTRAADHIVLSFPRSVSRSWKVFSHLVETRTGMKDRQYRPVRL